MLSHFDVSTQSQTATKRIVLCCGCVGLSFLAVAGFGVLQRTQGAENTLSTRQVSATPTKIQPNPVANYGKLALGFEANRGQADAWVRLLARGGVAGGPGSQPPAVVAHGHVPPLSFNK